MNVIILTAAPIPEAMPVYTSSFIVGVSGIIKGFVVADAVADAVADTVADAVVDGLATAVCDTVAVIDGDADILNLADGDTEALEELVKVAFNGWVLTSGIKTRTERIR